ncbi:hypothetical protein Slin15195_G079970 [Septoria linicola]|uniref:Uncharacterized protein n=1 Tax=Septoria linicola TaxID=215465 RepID=A0A9Q9EMP5_9PEZI|nr:hypothetical protein Slin15195_G079970 [Septoria linicola]
MNAIRRRKSQPSILKSRSEYVSPPPGPAPNSPVTLGLRSAEKKHQRIVFFYTHGIPWCAYPMLMLLHMAARSLSFASMSDSSFAAEEDEEPVKARFNQLLEELLKEGFEVDFSSCLRGFLDFFDDVLDRVLVVLVVLVVRVEGVAAES